MKDRKGGGHFKQVTVFLEGKSWGVDITAAEPQASVSCTHLVGRGFILTDL